MEIRIAIDTEEGDDFIDWLKTQGHDADWSGDTGNYIDGLWTSNESLDDPSPSTVMNQLWEDFCNS